MTGFLRYCMAAVLATAIVGSVASAQVTTTTTAVWTGTGGLDGSWSNTLNWSGGAVPASSVNTSLTFGITSGTTTLTQDLGDPLVLNSLTIIRGTGGSFTLNGGSLLLSGNNSQLIYSGTASVAGVVTQTINNNLIIGGNGLSIISTGTNGNQLAL